MADGEDAGQLAATVSFSSGAEDHLTTGSEDEDCDELYRDSPGRPLTSSTPPQRAVLAPSPRPVHEPKPSATQYQQPPRPPPPAAPRHQVPPPPPPQAQHQRAPRGDAACSSSSFSPPGTALYISELPWWATDAEVEAAIALVPRAAPALRELYFYTDKITGKSRGVCRADFLSHDAAVSAAAALNGQAFHGRHCVASLLRPTSLNLTGDDSNTEPVQAAPNPSRGGHGVGRGASNTTPVRGNVGPILGDRQTLAPLPQLSMTPRPHGPPFGATMGAGGGYGGFHPLGQFNELMGAGMMPPAVAPHVNPAFLAAGRMPMCGPGVWPDQAMGGGLWGAQPPWNVGGYQLPWQQPALPMQAQQHADENYMEGRGMRRGRPGRSDERGTGNDNVRSYPEKRRSDHDGGDSYKERDHEERSRHRERSAEKERETERHWEERDRRRGKERRHQEYPEDDDDDRRARSRSKNQSKSDDYEDHDDDRRARSRSKNRSRTDGNEDDDDDRRARSRAKNQSRDDDYDDHSRRRRRR